MDKEQIVTQQQPDDDVHGRASHKQNTGLHTCILYGSGELAVGQREDDVSQTDVGSGPSAKKLPRALFDGCADPASVVRQGMSF